MPERQRHQGDHAARDLSRVGVAEARISRSLGVIALAVLNRVGVTRGTLEERRDPLAIL